MKKVLPVGAFGSVEDKGVSGTPEMLPVISG